MTVTSYTHKPIDSRSYEAYHFARISKLDELKSLDPVAFERFVGELFSNMGYEIEYTPSSGDEGVDIFLKKDGNTSIVQCKRYDGQVGQPVVRDLYGVMLHNHAYEAYLVTTGYFSLPAQAWVEGKQIRLVDGNTLLEWIGFVSPDKIPPIPVDVVKSRPVFFKYLAYFGIGFGVLLFLFILAVISSM